MSDTPCADVWSAMAELGAALEELANNGPLPEVLVKLSALLEEAEETVQDLAAEEDEAQ